MLENIKIAAQAKQNAMIDFAQRLVRIPSMSGEEGQIAQVIRAEMEALGYDAVWLDEVGNVIGKIAGGDGPPVLLNGHMDHVAVGPVKDWLYPPFSGQIVAGELWGRASVDMKGPLACMIYATALLKQLGLTPRGDVLMTVPVMEETGGTGSRYLASSLKAAVAICGEPSHNTLRRGHRGRIELLVTFKGRSAHASVPHLAINPHYAAARFLTQLMTLPFVHDDVLGISSVAPTLYYTDQISPNVIPSELRLILDWRNVPSETPQAIVAKVKALLDSCLQDSHVQTTVVINSAEFVTYTGFTQTIPSILPSYLLSIHDPSIQIAQNTLTQILGRDAGLEVWQFATDGGHLMAAGIPTIGFGPGNEQLAHTNQERISLAEMVEALGAYTALILALGDSGLVIKLD